MGLSTAHAMEHSMRFEADGCRCGSGLHREHCREQSQADGCPLSLQRVKLSDWIVLSTLVESAFACVFEVT